MKGTLSPLRSVIEILDDELATADEQFENMIAADPIVKRLTTLPGIGPAKLERYGSELLAVMPI